MQWRKVSAVMIYTNLAIANARDQEPWIVHNPWATTPLNELLRWQMRSCFSSVCLSSLQLGMMKRNGKPMSNEGTYATLRSKLQVNGTTLKHRIAEIHAISMKRLSKIETDDDPSDGAGDE
jgi:hypothetical protein